MELRSTTNDENMRRQIYHSIGLGAQQVVEVWCREPVSELDQRTFKAPPTVATEHA